MKRSHIVIVLVLVVAVVALVWLIGWAWYKQPSPDSGQADPSSAQQQTDSDATDGAGGSDNYRHQALGVSMTLPENWLSLECQDRDDDVVYFASDHRGLGHSSSDQSILCGSGTDFPPQAMVQRITHQQMYIDESGAVSRLTIDGHDATKVVAVSDGLLYPEGFETTSYFIELGDSVLVATYQRWPEGTEGYDTSIDSRQAFVDMIEGSLKLL